MILGHSSGVAAALAVQKMQLRGKTGHAQKPPAPRGGAALPEVAAAAAAAASVHDIDTGEVFVHVMAAVVVSEFVLLCACSLFPKR